MRRRDDSAIIGKSSWTYSKTAYSCPKALQNSSWKDVTAVTDVKIGGEGLRMGCFHVNRFATSLRLNWSFFDEASQYRQKLKMKVAWELLLWTASYQINIDQLPIKMATSFWTFLLLQCWKPLQDWIETLLSGVFWAELIEELVVKQTWSPLQKKH